MRQWKKIVIVFLGSCLLLFLLLFGGNPSDTASSPPPPREKDQTLFIALDGIPFSMVENLFHEGRLPGYQAPSRVISAFPSTTTTGFTGLFKALGGKKAPGYDARFYSYALNEVRGNLLEAYGFEAADYNHFFSYNRNTGFQQVVMYTAPHFALKRDMDQLQKLVWTNPQKEAIFFYVGSTDAAGHLDGPEKTQELLLEIVKKVEDLQETYKKQFHRNLRLVLFSDHGFHWDKLKKTDIGEFEDRLNAAGLKLVEQMKDDRSVVAITWGNISGGDFYTSPELTPKVSDILLQMDGVDLVVSQREGKIIVRSSRSGEENAEILFDPEGTRFGYRPLEGDPLSYREVVEELKKERKLDSKGLASEKDWFEKTKSYLYPDAPYRLWDAFHGLVQNPATILLSTRENYEFGDNLTRFGASLRGGIVGTHGALSLDSCSAFVMTNDPEIKLSPVLRYDEVFLPFKTMIGDLKKDSSEEHAPPEKGPRKSASREPSTSPR